ALGYEALSGEPETPIFFGKAVFRIPRDGAADIGEVGADLMRPARMQNDFYFRIFLFPFQNLVFRHNFFRTRYGAAEY
ncbi:hypothetical protein OSL60_28975, partial [Escherichia coli]|nr:hypothetical protein [Escherichia coli]